MRIPFLRPKPASAEPERARMAPMGDDPTEVQAARTQARRRLVGAVVLLLIGVVGFPVLFETQPRPLPIDTPIELPRRDSGAGSLTGQDAAPAQLRPLPVLAAEPGTEEPAASVAAASETKNATTSATTNATTSATATPAAAASPAAASAMSKVAPVVLGAAPLLAAPPAPASVAALAAPPEKPVAAAPVAAESGRYVIQAGAYSEAGKLREARARIEKLGLKTYTQVIESDKGVRTRVRVGPYATRAEAEAVAAQVKRSGLPAAILAL